jgi:hypothetical protein
LPGWILPQVIRMIMVESPLLIPTHIDAHCRSERQWDLTCGHHVLGDRSSEAVPFPEEGFSKPLAFLGS